MRRVLTRLRKRILHKPPIAFLVLGAGLSILFGCGSLAAFWSIERVISLP
jgi:hypothetical protein